MNNLEEYIKKNREAFDDKDLPAGHEARFTEKLEAALGPDAGSGTSPLVVKMPSRKYGSAIGWVAAAAAVAAIALIVRRPLNGGGDWFDGVGSDQIEIYQVYSDKMASLYETIFFKNPDGGMETAATAIAEESVPLFEQLPPELDDRERERILKEYYGTLLEGLQQISKTK